MFGETTQFARTYTDARRKFQAAAQIAGTPVRTYPHPMRGPDGEELATDVAWLGDPEARRVLVLTSGVHGPELFCGSAIQLDRLLGLDIRGVGDVPVLAGESVNPSGTRRL